MTVVHKLSGGCHCGNIRVNMGLTCAPDTYCPRACDCDYCRKHGASYISDVHGSLAIRVADQREIRKYRQGAGLADFILCRGCGVLVCVLYDRDGRLFAAVNANAVDARESLGAPQSVSPKRLSGQEKMQRWQEVWFSDVVLTGIEA